MKVQKYFMRTRMHGTPTGRPDYTLDGFVVSYIRHKGCDCAGCPTAPTACCARLSLPPLPQ